MPVIGFLRSTPLVPFQNLVTAFGLGLKEAGFVEGQNVAIEYRYADNQADRLPALVADLIRRPVAVIVANSGAALAAKAATTTIPIVFASGIDPIKQGLVASLNRPGGNITGVNFFSGVLGSKRLELLRQLVPKATAIGMLANPDTAESEAERNDVQAAAQAIGQQLIVLEVRSDRDIETAFATFRPTQGWCAARRCRRVRDLEAGPTIDRAGGSPCAAGDSSPARGSRGRCRDELRAQPKRCLSPGRRLRRPDSQGREARRPAGHAGPPNSSWCSTSRPPRRSASKSRRCCSRSPTR